MRRHVPTMFRLTREGAVARLVLDRPEVRNAIPVAGWAELARLLGTVGDARLLMVAGKGGFCAGADLTDFPAMRGDEGSAARFRKSMREALDVLRDLPIPTVALIEGACYGAGVALAMACDLRLATPAARFAITPARIGISYPQEDVHRLVALIGPSQAARLLFTGMTIDGAEAARIGLVELFNTGDDSLADIILANDPVSLASLKRAISLAALGIRSDPDQDRRFDALLAAEELAGRLEARRRK